MPDRISITISALALGVSAVNAWLTLFRRGTIRMTWPSLIGFLYDQPDGDPKVFFRTMLYSTGKRGHVVESMYLKVRRGESSQTFSFWMYGETKSLLIGSGLRVTEDGVAVNHHFMPHRDGASAFQFLPGTYEIAVYAKLIHQRKTVLLKTMKVGLKEDNASALRDKSAGVLFNWGPDAEWYHPHVSKAPETFGQVNP